MKLINQQFNIDSVKKSLSNQKIEQLKLLYSEYSLRFRQSSSQIWTTGSVFIPLSLAGILSKYLNSKNVVFIAVFSSLLIWIWFFLSSRIRFLLDRYLAICGLIESIILNFEGEEIPRSLVDCLIPVKEKWFLKLKFGRLIIAILISICWVITAIYKYPQ